MRPPACRVLHPSNYALGVVRLAVAVDMLHTDSPKFFGLISQRPISTLGGITMKMKLAVILAGALLSAVPFAISQDAGSTDKTQDKDQKTSTGNPVKKAAKATAKDTEKGAKVATKDTEKGAKVAGKDTEKGAKMAGKDTEKGAKVAGKDTEKAAKKTGSAMKKGAEETGHEVKKGAEKTADAVK
jgi:hypothetical protein